MKKLLLIASGFSLSLILVMVLSFSLPTTSNAQLSDKLPPGKHMMNYTCPMSGVVIQVCAGIGGTCTPSMSETCPE